MDFAVADGGHGDDGHIEGFKKAPSFDEGVAGRAQQENKAEHHNQGKKVFRAAQGRFRS